MGGFKSAPLPGDPGGGGDSDPPAGPSSPAPSFSDIGGSSLGGLSSGGGTLSGAVGPGAANDPGDVLRVESVLADADLLDRPPGRSFKDDTFSAIKTAQARLNDDPRVDVGRRPLKLDGLVNPDGPTEAATRRLAGGVIARRAASAPKPQPPRPATAPSAATKTVHGGSSRVVATPLGRRRETLEQTVKRVAKGKPLGAQKPPLATKPAMTDDQVAALERLAGGLRKVSHPGPVAKDIADAFRADAPGTVNEFKVVRDVLEKTATESQVNNFTEGVRAELNPKDRGRFDKLLAGTDGGGKAPPLTGPGGEGQKGERPDPETKFDKITDKKFDEFLQSQGLEKEERQRVMDNFKSLLTPEKIDTSALDGKSKAGMIDEMVKLGITPETAGNVAEFGKEAVANAIDIAKNNGQSERAVNAFASVVQKFGLGGFASPKDLGIDPFGKR